jgi:glutathione S-transferase
LGLSYESRPIGPRGGETQTPEFTRINPSQKIPVLQEDDFTLTESAAIVTYLGEIYGGSRGLVPPAATEERALYYQWSFFLMMELDAHTLYIIRKHADLKDIYGEAPSALRAAEDGFQKQVQVADQRLAFGRPFILGERFSGADILLTTCLTSAVRRQIPLSDTLRRYVERTTEREAYTLALKANQPVSRR